MKVCSKCRVEKDLSEFNNRASAKDGKNHACRLCSNRESKNHYNKNGASVRSAVQQRRKQAQARFAEFKQTLQCCTCGENDPVCLDFHHLDPTHKELEVSLMIYSFGWERVQQEIDKCVVVCANCHRKVHAGHIIIPPKLDGDACGKADSLLSCGPENGS